jgi:proline dehydrogenase
MGLFDRSVALVLPAVPRPIVQWLSSRYIAGPHLDDAVRVVRELNEQGKQATIDVLGEEITNPEEAHAIFEAYEEVFAAIQREKLRSTVSVKLTGLGLKLSYDLCRENLEALVDDARRRKSFVRIDMEDSSTTDDTLQLYRELRDAGYDNLGIVLQASLKRTVQDVRDLADLQPNVRVTKGIYLEPSEIQFRDADAVRASFVRTLEELLDAGGYAAIATHDDWLIEQSLRLVHERSLTRREYEFQLLLGVRPEVGDGLVEEGHRVRIYVPFGDKWYEYSMRRLQENPKVAGYVALDTLARLKP